MVVPGVAVLGFDGRFGSGLFFELRNVLGAASVVKGAEAISIEDSQEVGAEAVFINDIVLEGIVES